MSTHTQITEEKLGRQQRAWRKFIASSLSRRFYIAATLLVVLIIFFLYFCNFPNYDFFQNGKRYAFAMLRSKTVFSWRAYCFVGTGQWCDTKLRISPPIMKQCFWNLAGMLHLTKCTNWYTFNVAMATCSVPVSCLFKIQYYSTRQNTWSLLRHMPVPPSLGRLFKIFSCILCPVQSQMVILNFGEAGDWNWACCHSNIKMCTTW